MTRAGLLAIAAATLVAAAGLAWFAASRHEPSAGPAFGIAIGAPFKLTAHNGMPFDSRSLHGKPYLVFFGFTHCPDVCPTTLLDITNHLQALGADGRNLNALFVTVDPERDTARHLSRYLQSFSPQITGLTGTGEEIAAVARSFRVTYRKVPTPSGHTFDHTSSVFLINRTGTFAGTLSLQESQSIQAAKLRRLVGGT